MSASKFAAGIFRFGMAPRELVFSVDAQDVIFDITLALILCPYYTNESLYQYARKRDLL